MQRHFRLVADYAVTSHQSVNLLGDFSAASPAQARSPLLASHAAPRKLGLFRCLGFHQPSGFSAMALKLRCSSPSPSVWWGIT